jgi:poly-gamma-glutamate synthesis protein (capsule biosynthesis protein)
MKTFKIAFVGDIMLAREVGNALKRNPALRILADDVIQDLLAADFRVGNLECPLTIKGEKYKKSAFKANPLALGSIPKFELLTLANNHIFDCGNYGAQETIEVLENQRINWVGLSKNDDFSFFKISVKDKTFCFINCAVKSCIQNQTEGGFKINEANASLLSKIKEFRLECDFLILLVHGDTEMIPYPHPNFMNFMHAFADNGVNVIVTHHPHVLGGMEKYNNCLIFYSLGDFVFDAESNFRKRSAILFLDFDLNNNSIISRIKPLKINGLRIEAADEQYSKLILRSYAKVSKEIQNPLYQRKYKYFYRYSLFRFQVDRLLYQFKNKGLAYMVKFILKKIALIPVYAGKFFNGNLKN